MSPLALVLAATLALIGPSGPTTPPAAPAARVEARAHAPAPSAHGVWPLPPPHTVVRGFEPPSSLWGPGHRGVDLAGHVGEPVRAALGGTITFASVLAGRGVVVVDHGATRTTYEPVAATVTVGDTVSEGEQIGTLTLAESHCFPRACLHWGYLRGTTYLDPLVLVGGGPVRLLPPKR
ncbi:MAG TPA: M23 family metallopeptidase [Marmoricola sp.]